MSEYEQPIDPTSQQDKDTRFAEVYPLSEKERSIFHNPNILDESLNTNWEHKNGSGKSHIVSNEAGISSFKDTLTPLDNKPSGIYIGLGAEQNYTLMAYGKPAFALLFDHDPAVLAAHHLHRAAFLNSGTIDEFIKFYDNDTVNESIEKINVVYQNNPQVAEMLVNMMKEPSIRTSFLARFRMMRVQYEGATGHYKDTFLNSEEDFRYLRTMYKEDRIRLSMGNLYDPQFIEQIGKVSSDLQQSIIGFYMSNAPDYEPNEFAKIIHALAEVPISEDAALLTTTQTFSAMRRIGGNWSHVGQDDWAYMTIPFSDLPKSA